MTTGRGRRRWVRGSMLAAGIAASWTATAHAEITVPTGFEVRPIVTGLHQPTGFAAVPDGRTVVVQKAGYINLGLPGTTTPRLLVNLSDDVNSPSDRGLLGVAVDPNPTSLGDFRVYILYARESPTASTKDSRTAVSSVLERFLLTKDNTVRPGSREIVLGKDGMGRPCPTPPDDTVDCIPADHPAHVIGTVRIAPDGTLFVGTGDSARYDIADPLALRTYDERSPAGKILHVDAQGRGLAGHHYCPGVTDLTRTCTKLYAKGLRNPFRFNLRPGGGLVVGDVGWETYEELDVLTGPGANAGWPCREGPIATPGYEDMSACAGVTGTLEPAAYGCHGGASARGECPSGLQISNSITAGPVYDRTTYPSTWSGWTFVGDFNHRWIKAVQGGPGGGTWKGFARDVAPVELQLTAAGNLAFADMGDFTAGSGTVQQIVYVGGGNRTPTAVATSDRVTGAAPLTVAFQSGGSSDPDGDALRYSWDFDDGTTSASANPTHTFARGQYQVRLTVTDPSGATDSDTLEISSGLSAPTATITSPPDGSTFRGGATIVLHGSATDDEDGTLPGTSLSWDVTIGHNEHRHVVLSGATGNRVSFQAATDHSADGRYDVRLVATDSDGIRSAPRTIRLEPELVPVTVGSRPAGVPLTFAGRTVTNATSNEAIGFTTTVSAPLAATVSGRRLEFRSWSDGGARTHDVTIPDAALTLTANYAVVNRAPVVTLDAGNRLYRDGVRRFVPGTAIDPDSGDTLTTAWEVRRIDTGDNVVATGTDLTPRFWPNAYAPASARYRVRLTAIDDGGLSATKEVVLAPELTDVSVTASHAGITLRNGGVRKEPIGRLITIGAPAEATPPGYLYRFVSWSDGGAPEHEIRVPVGGLSRVATYQRVNRAPTVRLSSDRLYRNGQREVVAVTARDADAGDTLTTAWKVTRTDTGGNVVREGTGTSPAWWPNVSAPASARYVVTVTTRDAAGRSATARATFAPETVRVVVRADPSSIAIAYGGGDRLEPIGRRMTVTAYPSSGSYTFSSWSDGGERSHAVAVPVAGMVLVARYVTTRAAMVQRRDRL